MYSIALKKAAAGAVLFLVGCACFASDNSPRILKEPILGLRYDRSKTQFETLPRSEACKCESNENLTSVWFIYGKFKVNSGRTYYVTGGYDVWNQPEPGQEKYDADDYGAVIYIDGDKCVLLDEARQTFIDRIFNDEMSQRALQALALDVVKRLETAFGGPDKLSAELHKQHADLTVLPVELRNAFKPYLNGASPHE
jgi:hypothetical protein